MGYPAVPEASHDRQRDLGLDVTHLPSGAVDSQRQHPGRQDRANLSGVEVDLTFAALYTVRDGKVARGREYWTKEQALEAAGLRE
jgi:ketosteroid isomerase-like protein